MKMIGKTKPGDKDVHYYGTGAVKKYGGTVYALGDNDRYVIDFYHDYEDVAVPEKEITEKEALQTYVKINGTSEGFYELWA